MFTESIRQQVIFDVPGGEDAGAVEQNATPTMKDQPDASGVNPVSAILMGAAMFVLGVFGLRKLLD